MDMNTCNVTHGGESLCPRNIPETGTSLNVELATIKSLTVLVNDSYVHMSTLLKLLSIVTTND